MIDILRISAHNAQIDIKQNAQPSQAGHFYLTS